MNRNVIIATFVIIVSIIMLGMLVYIHTQHANTYQHIRALTEPSLSFIGNSTNSTTSSTSVQTTSTNTTTLNTTTTVNATTTVNTTTTLNSTCTANCSNSGYGNDVLIGSVGAAVIAGAYFLLTRLRGKGKF